MKIDPFFPLLMCEVLIILSVLAGVTAVKLRKMRALNQALLPIGREELIQMVEDNIRRIQACIASCSEDMDDMDALFQKRAFQLNLEMMNRIHASLEKDISALDMVSISLTDAFQETAVREFRALHGTLVAHQNRSDEEQEAAEEASGSGDAEERNDPADEPIRDAETPEPSVREEEAEEEEPEEELMMTMDFDAALIAFQETGEKIHRLRDIHKDLKKMLNPMEDHAIKSDEAREFLRMNLEEAEPMIEECHRTNRELSMCMKTFEQINQELLDKSRGSSEDEPSIEKTETETETET